MNIVTQIIKIKLNLLCNKRSKKNSYIKAQSSYFLRIQLYQIQDLYHFYQKKLDIGPLLLLPEEKCIVFFRKHFHNFSSLLYRCQNSKDQLKVCCRQFDIISVSNHLLSLLNRKMSKSRYLIILRYFGTGRVSAN